MELTPVIIAAVVIGVIAVLVGLLLGKASEIFKVEVDEKVIKVRECLPGNNCGACGYPGCDGMAEAIAKGEAPMNGCPVGGPDVADQIAAIMGGSAEKAEKMVARVACKGDCEQAVDLYDYVGPKSCRIAGNTPNGGPKGCTFGCLGYGECKSVCEFGAISIVDGIAVVDPEKCKACGMCVKACPRGIIKMVPYEKQHHIECNSKDKGPEVMKVCKAGCIGCTMCARNCPTEAITMDGTLPVIDYSKCTNCGTCAEKCPKKCISK